MSIPKVSLPSSLQSLFEYIAIENIGVRYLNETEFCRVGLEKLAEVFLKTSEFEQQSLLRFLRECARTSCSLPTSIPSSLSPIPVLTTNDWSLSELNSLFVKCSRDNLALPAFDVGDIHYTNNALNVYRATISNNVRGPLYLMTKLPISPSLQAIGVLNAFTPQTQILPKSDIAKSCEILRSLQWFRQRVLSLTEPWMFKGCAEN